jgi:hypothetical protein
MTKTAADSSIWVGLSLNFFFGTAVGGTMITQMPVMSLGGSHMGNVGVF